MMSSAERRAAAKQLLIVESSIADLMAMEGFRRLLGKANQKELLELASWCRAAATEMQGLGPLRREIGTEFDGVSPTSPG